MADKWPRIPDFYSGRSILVTGFSGFMGKLLVQKLLWSCPDIKTIYVILRGKRHLTYQQRFQKIINSDVFDRVRDNKEEQLKKIQVLEGDIVLDNLGLTQQQRSLLSDEVSILFHGAATVNFDDPLPQSLDINVKGTRNVTELALLMPNLVAFVHISTAYTNCDRRVIEEKVYPPKADWKKSIEIREKLDDTYLRILAPKYTDHMINTYVFTKSLGEQIIAEYSDRIPMVIFRPSIVASSWEEPFSGWSENLNGPISLALGLGTGILRSLIITIDGRADFMPVDIGVRGLVVAAYFRHYQREDGLQLYNWCSQERSPTSRLILEMSEWAQNVQPSKYVLWRPTTSSTESWFLCYLNFYIFQLLPAFFLDLLIRLFGQKTMMWKLQKKAFVTMKALSFFMLFNFHFHNENSVQREHLIRKEDLAEFSYVKQYNPEPLFKYGIAQLKYLQRKYLKQKPEDTPAAIRLNKIMKGLDIVVKTCFWTWLAYTVYNLNLIPRFLKSALLFLIPHLTH